MIPPLPWQLAVPQSPPSDDYVYIVDREGEQVIAAAVPRATAALIVTAVNRLTDAQVAEAVR